MSTATAPTTIAAPAATTAPATTPLDFAVQQILAKQGRQAILTQLSARWGFSSEDALAIVNRAYAIKRAAFRQAGAKTLQTGVIMLLIGVLITWATYSMVKEQGGTYIVTYGLIFVGALNILKGLFRIVVG